MSQAAQQEVRASPLPEGGPPRGCLCARVRGPWRRGWQRVSVFPLLQQGCRLHASMWPRLVKGGCAALCRLVTLVPLVTLGGPSKIAAAAAAVRVVVVVAVALALVVDEPLLRV